MVEFFDTHCHIHEARVASEREEVPNKWQKGGFTQPDTLIESALEAGVSTMLCIGCTYADSVLAVKLAQAESSCYASIGIHPHEAKSHNSRAKLDEFASLVTEEKVIAIGECGLDYYYENSPSTDQIQVLEYQLDVAAKHNLPVSFHVREAFDDFWPIFDNFKGLRGVLHSFTANRRILDEALKRDLYVGLNGIMTFTKDEEQLAMAKAVPLNKLLLETDAPFLTPTPYRGKICQPRHVVVTAEFLSSLRGEPLEELAAATTHNAKELLGLL